MIRLAKRGTASASAFVSCLTARWTLSSAPSGQEVRGQEGEDDHCRHDSDDGDGGGGYDHMAILAPSVLHASAALYLGIAALWP